MMDNTKPQGSFHDAITGETIVRELTPEEFDAIPKEIITEPLEPE